MEVIDVTNKAQVKALKFKAKLNALDAESRAKWRQMAMEKIRERSSLKAASKLTGNSDVMHSIPASPTSPKLKQMDIKPALTKLSEERR